jgi:glyoxylase-like metal-dependent hydrolase (beta-lactamase superfamily II)
MPFAENTYIVWLDGRSDCLVVDPGLEPGLILDFLQENALRPALILNTHGHADHIAGNAALKEACADAPLVIGAGDEPLLSDAVANLSALFGYAIQSPPADRLVRDGERIDGAGMTLEVLEIPGHSPGHVVYVLRGQPDIVLGGDVLFEGSIGRSDFPYGNYEQLVGGIRTKLFALPDDTIVYPGHGGPTTIGREKRSNPFCR